MRTETARIISVATLIMSAAMFATAAQPTIPVAIDLSGQWQVQLDPDDQGIEQQWYNQTFEHVLTLPGSLAEHGYGNDIDVNTSFVGHIFHEWYDSSRYAPYRVKGNIKIPSFLQPPKHYSGAAWYTRTVEIPPQWNGYHTALFLERCQFETTLWVDGKPVGSQNTLSVPHEYELGILTPGEHRISIRIDNRMVVRLGVPHAVNDWIQTNWNGVIGRMELHAKSGIHIQDIQVYPDLEQKCFDLKLAITNHNSHDVPARLEVQGWLSGDPTDLPKVADSQIISPGTGEYHITYPLGDKAVFWDEFAPNVYRLEVILESAEGMDRYQTTAGLRRFEISGSHFAINNRPIMLRGTNEAGLFPLTGYPAMDTASWRRILDRCKEFGLNHMRFHSWCPPKAAFEAADETGIYFQVEGPFNGRIGNGEPVDRYLHEEMQRILRTYGNHPSFVMMAHGNEPSGDHKEKLLAQELEYWRSIDNRHQYTAGSGWPMIEENDFHCNHSPRLQLWGEGLQSKINAVPPNTQDDFSDIYRTTDKPLVIHESGQWCVYPNFDEIPKYQGVLKPRNFEIFRDFLRENHMESQARDFLMASGRLQVLCYKAEIEYALRTPDCAGFQLLDIHDYSGQGSALVGVLDPFWDPKPYIQSDEWRQFCCETVPLARIPKLVWTDKEAFQAQLEIYHYGPQPIENAALDWSLEDMSGAVIEQGSITDLSIPFGNHAVGPMLQIQLNNWQTPARYRLTTRLRDTDYHNQWDFWVYPDKTDSAPPPSKIHITTNLDEGALACLKNGGKVLLLADPRGLESPVKIGFSNMFWNVSFTGNQAPHTVGLLCNPEHPVFGCFPTDYHSNWQWWDLIRHSAALIIDDLPEDLQPLIQPIDNWFYARRLSLLLEARVEGGSLMVCTIDIDSDLESRPAARQLRHSIMQYMNQDSFQPAIDVSSAAIHDLLKPVLRDSTLKQLGATIHTVSAQTQTAPATNMLDGSKETIWLSNRQYDKAMPPHEVVFDLGKSVNIAGLVYVPRQDAYGGRVGDYDIYVSDSPDFPEPVVATGRWQDNPDEQRVIFDQPYQGRYLKLIAKNEVHNWTYVAIAEIDIIVDWRN